MKTSVDRIPYYLRKLAQYTAIHPSKRRNPYRHDRLMFYKAGMDKQIGEEHPKIYERTQSM
ncbi:hypothetical protein [Radiobacillus sp. PE A8.2]|uniref:hypothetical protein n=1 Tax=Radiobacillus sp. PE A8.2 TaxID=3380349 RepID=UPI00388D50FC